MTVERLDAGAHTPERLGDALHRASRQRRVADELEPAVLPRDETGQEPHQRSRVPAVDGRSGLDEATEADPVHRQGVDVVLVHLDSEGPNRRDRRLGVGRAAEPGDPRLALAQRADEHSTM